MESTVLLVLVIKKISISF